MNYVTNIQPQKMTQKRHVKYNLVKVVILAFF